MTEKKKLKVFLADAPSPGGGNPHVLGIRCALEHSGNRRFYRSQRGSGQCGGCGNSVRLDERTQFEDRSHALVAEKHALRYID